MSQLRRITTLNNTGSKNHKPKQPEKNEAAAADEETAKAQAAKADVKSEDSAEAKQTEVKTAETEKAQPDLKDKKIALLSDQLLRQMAEFDNYRKRTANERRDLEAQIKAKLAAEFLVVMDNLERALACECSDTEYKKGVELVKDSFSALLKNAGIEEIDTAGQFDPNVHQAVAQVPDETKESGQIAATFQKGYKLGDKVLRFAMVSVVK
jgi:molecular chaperone GrpE